MKPVRSVLVVGMCAMVILAAVHGSATAQIRFAELSGTVTDPDGSPLPGVTIIATNLETGQSRTTVTGPNGGYHLPGLPVGRYTFRAELTGFNPVEVEESRLAIGESAVLNLTMAIASVEEMVTVTAVQPLVDTKKSDLSGRIDNIQMEELPINGRDWMQLSSLAPGVKGTGGNADQGTGGQPTSGVGDSRTSKVILDGGAIQNLSTQAIDLNVSKEIIGEFEVLTNRFDAQMGRAGTTAVNAVTKGGSDTFHGAGYFYFRDESLNATDFFTGEKEPFRVEQYGGTLGGPVVRGKTHFFVNYERQRQPRTVSSNTGFEIFDQPVPGGPTINMYFIRADQNVGDGHHVSVRYNHYDELLPNADVGGGRSISNAHTFDFATDRFNANVNSVFGNNFHNQFYVTYLSSERFFNRFDGPPPPEEFGLAPFDNNQHVFPSVTIGAVTNVGNEFPDFWVFRNDASWYVEKWGQQSIKLGVEYVNQYIEGTFASNGNGTFFYDEDPPNLATCCPGGDQSSWDKSQFPIPTRYSQAIGNFRYDAPNEIFAAYLQDDWTISDRLTLNLGLRYDLEKGSLASDNRGLLAEPHDSDTNNFQPRFGFAWDLTGEGRTVVRGGSGLYVDQVFLNITFNQRRTNRGDLFLVTLFNPDLDPAFATNPFGDLTFEDFAAGAGPTNISLIDPDAEQPMIWTSSIGVAHSLSANLGVSLDYVYQESDNMLRSVDENLFCCTADGWPLPVNGGFYPELGGFFEGSGRPNPTFNRISVTKSIGRSKYHGLQVALTKRWSDDYQFKLTYLLSKNEDDHGGAFSRANNPFDLADEYGTSALDQRHRLVLNWVTAFLPGDIYFGGILFASSGQALGVSTGGIDINGDGDSGGDRPTCGLDPRFDNACSILGVADGQRIPRNPLRSAANFRVDINLSKTFQLPGFTIEPILEIYNLFNRNNLVPGGYNTNLASTGFGQPGRSSALGHLPRSVQLAIRAAF